MATREEDRMGEPGGVDGRTLALSDGIFAIALTLLVLAIHEPEPAKGQTLASALWDQKGEILAWIWSFAVVSSYWARHRSYLTHLKGFDGRLTQLNLVFLGGVAFVPYPTNVMAKFGADIAAVSLYAGTLAVVSALLGLMMLHAARVGLLPHGDTGRRWWIGPLLTLSVIPLSQLVGGWAFLLWFALPRATVPIQSADPSRGAG